MIINLIDINCVVVSIILNCKFSNNEPVRIKEGGISSSEGETTNVKDIKDNKEVGKEFETQLNSGGKWNWASQFNSKRKESSDIQFRFGGKNDLKDRFKTDGK